MARELLWMPAHDPASSKFSEHHRHCCRDIAWVEARMEGEGHSYRSPFGELTGANPQFDSVGCA
jgi:hypothetical protein